MKLLFLSADTWRTDVVNLATRGNGISNDPVRENQLNVHDATVCWVTVEEGDSLEKADTYVAMITQNHDDLGRPRLVLVPFAHLSHRLAPASLGRSILDRLVKTLAERGVDVVRDHFGSDKDVALVIKGHPGAVRFRSC